LTHHLLLLVFGMHNRNTVQKIGNPTRALVSLSTDIKELLQQLNQKIEEVIPSVCLPVAGLSSPGCM
jgi:hypothetical protein